MKKKFSLPFVGFLQATGLVAYIALVSLFFNVVGPNLDSSENKFYNPIIALLLFVTSAVISALIVLGKASVLFWEKKYKESFTLVGWTMGWDILYFALFILSVGFKQ